MKIALFTSCCIRKLLYLDLFHQEDVHGCIQVILHDNSQQVNRSLLTLLPGKPSRLVQPARTKTQEKAVQEARALDKGIMEFPRSEPVGKFVMGFVDDACAASPFLGQKVCIVCRTSSYCFLTLGFIWSHKELPNRFIAFKLFHRLKQWKHERYIKSVEMTWISSNSQHRTCQEPKSPTLLMMDPQVPRYAVVYSRWFGLFQRSHFLTFYAPTSV